MYLTTPGGNGATSSNGHEPHARQSLRSNDEGGLVPPGSARSGRPMPPSARSDKKPKRRGSISMRQPTSSVSQFEISKGRENAVIMQRLAGLDEKLDSTLRILVKGFNGLGIDSVVQPPDPRSSYHEERGPPVMKSGSQLRLSVDHETGPLRMPVSRQGSSRMALSRHHSMRSLKDVLDEPTPSRRGGSPRKKSHESPRKKSHEGDNPFDPAPATRDEQARARPTIPRVPIQSNGVIITVPRPPELRLKRQASHASALSYGADADDHAPDGRSSLTTEKDASPTSPTKVISSYHDKDKVYDANNPPLEKSGSRNSLGSKAMAIEGRSEFAYILWDILEGEASRHARMWIRGWCIFVCLSVLLTLSQSLGQNRPVSGMVASMLEAAVEISFLAEFITRCATSPDRKHLILSLYSVVDMLSFGPLVLRVATAFQPVEDMDPGSPVRRLLLFFVPSLRLLKVLSKQRLQLQIFGAVIDKVRESLVFLFCVGLTIALTAAACLHMVEPLHNLESYPHAAWLTIVSMSTLGYGDVAPITDEGRLVMACLIVFSTAYMAVPIGVLGNAFSSVWQDRDLILLVDKVQRMLMQWGYTVNHLDRLFAQFDSDGDGELDLADFCAMMQDLHVNLKDERLVDLFEIFDRDRGGTVDHLEFMHVIFPRSWHEMVMKQKEKEEAESRRAREELRRQGRMCSDNPGFHRSASDGQDDLKAHSKGPSWQRINSGEETPQRRSANSLEGHQANNSQLRAASDGHKDKDPPQQKASTDGQPAATAAPIPMTPKEVWA